MTHEESEYLDRCGGMKIEISGWGFKMIELEEFQPTPEREIPPGLLQLIYSQDDDLCTAPIDETKCRLRLAKDYSRQCSKAINVMIGDYWFCRQHSIMIKEKFGIE